VNPRRFASKSNLILLQKVRKGQRSALAWKLPNLPVKKFGELSRPNIMMHTPAWSGEIILILMKVNKGH